MAKAKSGTDQFAQIGYITVTQTAANTLTFAGLSVFSNVLGSKGMIIHSAEYVFGNSNGYALMVGSGDILACGLSGDDGLASVDLDDPQVYDYNSLLYLPYGTPADHEIFKNPIVRDWSSFPGGGLLVPADRLYLFCDSLSVASAATVQCRFRFTLIELAAQEYLELAQSLRVLK